MSVLRYELITCTINNQKVPLHGIKIDTKQDIKRITHSADYNAIGYVTGDKTVDFTLTEPKDVPILKRTYEEWINTHIPFFMLLSAKNLNTGEWDPVASLDGCVFTKVDHNLKAKEEWKPGVSGMALKFRSLNHQFDPNPPSILSDAKAAANKVEATTDKAKGVLNEVDRMGKLIGF